MMLELLFATAHFCAILHSARAQGGRIVGGQDAPDGVYDFLGIPDPQVCAGMLVHPQVLLTAAHCECGFSGVDVILGTNTAGDRRDALDVVPVSDQRIVHPSYSSITQNADLMLVKLSREASNTVPLVTIASSVPGAGSTVKAVGFGALSEGGRGSNTLQVVSVPIVAPSTCSDDRYYGDLVNEVTMVCAGVEGKDSCQGDSGGPLLDSSNRLVGITSFGIGCGRELRPGVYTNVPHFRPFIEDAICALADNPPSFCNGMPSNSLRLSDGVCRPLIGQLICLSSFLCVLYDAFTFALGFFGNFFAF